MLALTLEDFMVELNDGSIKNVGPKNKAATAKLFDVESVEAREFGDKRVKLVFEDDDGNEIQISLFPEDVQKLTDDVEALEEDSPVFD
ncbi:hypothetical protein [Natronobacterium texcoconense]|uniref:Uncharacterized protein n=1 Tax=Natronobacterium texcoconense TaxID=1095778 RepID=A0A1H1IDU1_NATTX|nr:hypothetical protein [Natronobacterium texcoconense]SDR35903.1 hypothetical protein SAMN04489842_3475 [Natronobacterium texcoconense]